MKKESPKTGVGKTASKASAKRRPTLVSNPASIADIVDRYKKAVVNLEVVKRERSSSRRQRDSWPYQMDTDRERSNTMNIGTGFFFDPRGYILTNEHVVHDADEVYVRFFDKEEGVPAEVVGTSYELDLAVLKVKPPKGLAILPLGVSSKVRQGEWVFAIGCPLGLDHSVTVGIVSAKERPITIGDRHYPKLLQTDAAINRGNSGGPLINLRGEVVGMNTAVSASSQGIGFAIPVDVVKNAIDDLMGSRARRTATATKRK
ncbi:MAG: trypsin-like peptidase domain-containing protein [Tumebacillaceae bacterium]